MDKQEIPTGRIYKDLSFLMPLISPPEDYAEEAACWKSVLREGLGPGRHRVLELGVGPGCNLSHLTKDFEAVGVDLSREMLDQCRLLNPGVPLVQGDMRTVRLNRKFSAVLIHDAVSYLVSEDELRLTFETAASHLEKGGMLVMSPDFFKETFSGAREEEFTRSKDGLRLVYKELAVDLDPDDTQMEIIMYLEITQNGQFRVELDRHVFGLFPEGTWKRLMEEAGFSFVKRSFHHSKLDEPYRLLVGTLLR